MNEDISPPGLMLQMLEGRAGAEAAQLMLAMPLLRMQAIRGTGEPVMVLPGFMADDHSTYVLRHFLNAIGYKAYPWGLGINRRRMMDLLPQVTQGVQAIANESGQKAKLIGWSRGGILAREVARDYPDLVDRVITIGSPIKGGVSVSSIGSMVQRQTGLTPQQMAQLLRQRQQAPIKVPVRAIYSKLDGVVAWKACIDEDTQDVKHFEIRGSHIGMGTNVDVFKLLPKLLAEKNTQ